MKSLRRSFAIVAAVIWAVPGVAAVESCLVGTWIADRGDIADMMALQMNGRASFQGGEVSMQIMANGNFTMLANNMTLTVQVPDVPAFPVKVNGYSNGVLAATEGVFLAGVSTYDLVGSAIVLGSEMKIPFDSNTGFLGSGSGSFRCNSTELRFEEGLDGRSLRVPRLWRRAR